MTCADELTAAVREAAQRLRPVTEADAGRRPAPGKWCAKEIIGHLIDSASQNHRRFVVAASTDDLVFPGYDQAVSVETQKYREAGWAGLLDLWAAYNLHIARVMEAIPEDARLRPRKVHNLDETAWKPVPRDRPATLEYFMRDYLDHLRHHLGQIADLGLLPRG